MYSINHWVCYMILYFLHKMICVPYLFPVRQPKRWHLFPCVNVTAGKVSTKSILHDRPVVGITQDLEAVV